MGRAVYSDDNRVSYSWRWLQIPILYKKNGIKDNPKLNFNKFSFKFLNVPLTFQENMFIMCIVYVYRTVTNNC